LAEPDTTGIEVEWTRDAQADDGDEWSMSERDPE
jgi:hypothetical protein